MLKIILDPANVGLVMKVRPHEMCDYISAKDIWKVDPAITFICPGPMMDDKFTPIHLLVRYLDTKAGIDVKGRYWASQGSTISIVNGKPLFNKGKIVGDGATFALQGWPLLVKDFKYALEPGMPNLSAARWRTALCIGEDDSLFIYAGPKNLPGFCKEIVTLKAKHAVYLDGGHSATYQVKGGQVYGDPHHGSLGCWLVQRNITPEIVEV
jgi:hypothetical protein